MWDSRLGCPAERSEAPILRIRQLNQLCSSATSVVKIFLGPDRDEKFINENPCGQNCSEMGAEPSASPSNSRRFMKLPFGARRATGKHMILLVTPSARGQECAASLKDATGEETLWAETLQQAALRLREQAYSAVVIDQFLAESEPAESDQVFEHLGTAFPVYLSFAVSNMERLLREVRSALHRRKREETLARRSVEQQVRSEMFESLTAMLLSCDLAMAVPGVPNPAVEKIRLIDSLARDMRIKLGAN
jgi:hypothetical protein